MACPVNSQTDRICMQEAVGVSHNTNLECSLV